MCLLLLTRRPGGDLNMSEADKRCVKRGRVAEHTSWSTSGIGG